MAPATNRALEIVTPPREAFLGGDRKMLTPFDRRECLSLKDAADIAGKSESTMRGWCEQHGLGRRVGGGTWSVSKVALAMFLDGDEKALQHTTLGIGQVSWSIRISRECFTRSGTA
jgi:hypothetical protein